MTETADPHTEVPKKKSKLPLILGLVLALLGAGGGFFATQSGLLGGAAKPPKQLAEPVVPLTPDLAEIAFVALDPMIVSLGPNAQNRHLRFRAQLEVPIQHQAEVTAILPRVVDVLNNYLRALGPHDIERQDALILLRVQMLRRIQIVTGKGRVRDLLVMEFVLN
ncbi:flagellar basal body-associated FliL family protein [Cognatishimia sp. WU-CL00825]|uniref:flagellar basal body-associated FliL family protein n=1 Tax=Cognatishimia sp. WU-CL00825 TaxID=3127658 RepID=UPI0031048DA6